MLKKIVAWASWDFFVSTNVVVEASAEVVHINFQLSRRQWYVFIVQWKKVRMIHTQRGFVGHSLPIEVQC